MAYGRAMRVGFAVVSTACFLVSACQSNSETTEADKPATEASASEAAQKAATTKTATQSQSVRALTPAKKVIPAPDDVAAPPADAEKSESGLAWKVLEKSSSTEKPGGVNDIVEVHYTGWKTDGTMFDSSVVRGRPARFRVHGVIAGWTEGLQLMAAGEKRRFWIPEALAYKGLREPKGMLVFDIELLKITPGAETPKDVSAPPDSATKTESGVFTKVLVKGDGGDRPRMFDNTKVHITLWTGDGRLIRSTPEEGRPIDFPLRRMEERFPYITEAVQLMTIGEKRRLWLPAEKRARGGRVPPDDLMYDLELVRIIKGKPPIPAPADVAAPPATATRTESGVAYVQLKKGDGKAKPTRRNRVKVHYTGWTTDGNMFDSSVQRGEPAEFAVVGVIAGWTEMLQLMSTGEKVRVWIPQNLAYRGLAGKPAGTLVFEMELLEIK